MHLNPKPDPRQLRVLGGEMCVDRTEGTNKKKRNFNAFTYAEFPAGLIAYDKTEGSQQARITMLA